MSLWKREMLQQRNNWALQRNPKLDKFAGPLEVAPGITWRSVMKFNLFLMGLAGIISYANNRAYQKVYSERRANVTQHNKQTKDLLKEGAEDKVQLTTRDRLNAMLDQVQKDTGDWNPDKLVNIPIQRPEEGLTVDNLRESAIGFEAAAGNSALADRIEKMKK
eukprot:TRINITY_DN34932_c0_g1_i1.p1 TRINITY_DN34932_c0_g1~~TRINITY_DN34932_c0_g1_i1.p1  ORF type:complete len:170 (+),score=39.01 TRINITY_DN34932_c0_g1_i1:22-510(+)